MGKSNIEQLNIAKKYIGYGGSKFRKYCGLPSGSAWCDAYVTTIFHEAGNASLFCDGKKQTYCPTTMSLCAKNLASVPPYLALPSDIIFFDWEPNSTPNHIGFVRERKDCDSIYTIEGNTSGGIVANKVRNTKYVCGIYRPHFKPTAFDPNKRLVVDGLAGYNTIAILQRALKGLGCYSGDIDGILGQGTVKGIQRLGGTTQDGHWGNGTSRAVQKMLGVKADGLFGPDSVKALQRWCNDKVFPQRVKNKGQLIAETAQKYVGKVPYKKGGTDINKAVDCTGFIQEIYRLNGIKLSPYLSTWGKSIGTDIKKAQPGDIISFNNKKTGKLQHHAIYIGNGKVCHATGGKKVCISKLPFSNLKIEGIRRRWK